MMDRCSFTSLCAALLASAAVGQPLIFDDLPRNEHVGEGYAALGVHFSPTDNGVWDGISGGDPGGWHVEGTNGTAFMGFNGFPSYQMDIRFDAPVTGFSMDTTQTDGGRPGDGLNVAFWLAGVQVDSAQLVFPGLDIWTTIRTDQTVDRVSFTGYGVDFYPYAVDNIWFESSSECYPDFNGDGTLDLFDFLAFVNAFNAQDPGADCIDDGAFDLFDFLCFVNAFNAGC